MDGSQQNSNCMSIFGLEPRAQHLPKISRHYIPLAILQKLFTNNSPIRIQASVLITVLYTYAFMLMSLRFTIEGDRGVYFCGTLAENARINPILNSLFY